MFNYSKDFYAKQDLATLFRVLMHLVKGKKLEDTLPVREAIEEKLRAGLTEEESKEFANLLYLFCLKHSTLSRKEACNDGEASFKTN
ncbi:MAG: hypothetical protein JHC25_01225 [Thermodesulfobacterium sp.]|jgi:hypothetical protein|nr:hypothetical protein [Thermodesulfobacterium sp.]